MRAIPGAEGLPGAAAAGDPYVRYLREFFGRWSRVYDGFAATIGFAYGAAVRVAGASPGRSILDICTGTGEIAFRAARLGARVAAIDFTPPMLVRARRKRGGRSVAWLEMDARRLAFPAGSFDVAVLSFALHDMPRAACTKALLEAARVARDGVVILDYDPAARTAPGRLTLRLLETFETAYLRGFIERGGVAGAAADAGLRAVRLETLVPGLFALWWVAATSMDDPVAIPPAQIAVPRAARSAGRSAS